MQRRRDLSSKEMETLQRSRIPTVVIPANGEVQTNGEAQVYVHDVGLFLIVDIFEDTPCNSIVWKVCESHGRSYGWVSGQQPRLTKQGKQIKCKTGTSILD